MSTMRQDSLMSPKEVCRELGVGNKTLNRWIQLGWLRPVVRTLGGHGRFDRATVEMMRATPRRDWPGLIAGPVRAEPAYDENANNALPYHLRHKPRGELTDALAANIERTRRRAARAALDARELARLYDIAVWDLLGVERGELSSQLAIRPLAAVAAALGVADDRLRKVCQLYDVPIPGEADHSPRPSHQRHGGE